ncbi:head decoration protein [Cloacibacillus sp.]
MRDLYTKLGSVDPTNLIAGSRYPIDHIGVTLAEDTGEIKNGTVLGKITATGVYVLVDSTATDGSESPVCVLAEDIDTAILTDAVAYRCGYFYRDALIFGGSDTYENHELEMQRLGLYMTKGVNEKGAVA